MTIVEYRKINYTMQKNNSISYNKKPNNNAEISTVS